MTSTASAKSAPFFERPSLMRALHSGMQPPIEPSPGRTAARAGRLSGEDQPELPLDVDFAGVLHNLPLLTVRQAATELKCSDQHIRNFIDEGKMLAFPINIAEIPKRCDYRIVRKTAASAFTFLTHAQRAALALEIIRSVNLWLFSPYDPNIGAWKLALRIGARSALNVSEAAQALVCDGDHIRNLYAHRLIAGLDIASNPGSSPLHLRVSRDSLAAFVTRRLARQNNIDLAAPSVARPARTQNNIEL